jgi:CRP/FNR family transcriptional regulator, dissimilatory nitrate respiration regulator
MGNLQLLQNSQLCAHLDSSEVEQLIQVVTIREVPKGELIFLEGDDAAGFYILLRGSVRVYKASPEGREQTLHRIKPGQLFAEAAVFHGSRYPANCDALLDSTVAFFPKTEFVRLIERNPQMSLKMIASMAAFLRDFNQTIEMLSLKEVSARLAAWLLSAAGRAHSNQFTLPMSKGDLANVLGTVNETVSRNLRKMIDLGVLQVDNRDITIIDRTRLEAIAAGEKI